MDVDDKRLAAHMFLERAKIERAIADQRIELSSILVREYEDGHALIRGDARSALMDCFDELDALRGQHDALSFDKIAEKLECAKSTIASMLTAERWLIEDRGHKYFVGKKSFSSIVEAALFYRIKESTAATRFHSSDHADWRIGE